MLNTVCVSELVSSRPIDAGVDDVKVAIRFRSCLIEKEQSTCRI